MQVIPIRRTCQFVAVHEIFQSVYWISCGKRQIPLWKIMPLAPLRCKWRGFESHLIVFLTVNKLRGQSSCLKNRKNLLNYWTLCPIKKRNTRIKEKLGSFANRVSDNKHFALFDEDTVNMEFSPNDFIPTKRVLTQSKTALCL